MMNSGSRRNWTGKVALAAVLAIGLAPGWARAEGFAEKHPRRAEVNRRERHQQDRIAKGIESGRLNPSEASKLEGQEATLKAQERAEVKHNGGYLTKGETRRLNHEEDQLSHEIQRDKTN
jgi:hypothetical protein